jgi:hypothetical protein
MSVLPGKRPFWRGPDTQARQQGQQRTDIQGIVEAHNLQLGALLPLSEGECQGGHKVGECEGRPEYPGGAGDEPLNPW